MANLIITVVSIALVAVAALMGAYYGGTAFMDGQTKTRANTWITQAEQIAAAIRLWSANNGGNQTLTLNTYWCGIWPAYTEILTQGYLSSLPSQDWHQGYANNYWKWSVMNKDTTNTDCTRADILISQSNFPLTSSIDKICTSINSSVGAPTISKNATDTFATVIGSYPYRCVTTQSGTQYLLLYRVF